MNHGLQWKVAKLCIFSYSLFSPGCRKFKIQRFVRAVSKPVNKAESNAPFSLFWGSQKVKLNFYSSECETTANYIFAFPFVHIAKEKNPL